MTTNTTFTQTCLSTAEEITELLDSLGFTSDQPVDNLKETIAGVIERRVQSVEPSPVAPPDENDF